MGQKAARPSPTSTVNIATVHNTKFQAVLRMVLLLQAEAFLLHLVARKSLITYRTSTIDPPFRDRIQAPFSPKSILTVENNLTEAFLLHLVARRSLITLVWDFYGSSL